jgi:hypothetical protein
MTNQEHLDHGKGERRSLFVENSYVWIKVREAGAGHVANLVLTHTELSSILAERKGIDRGRPVDAARYRQFFEGEYWAIVQAHASEVFDFDLREVQSSFARVGFRGDEIAAATYLKSKTFDRALVFQDLPVSGKEELLDTWFDLNPSSSIRTLKKSFVRYEANPAFIAMLLSFGCQVAKGDVVPILLVKC